MKLYITSLNIIMAGVLFILLPLCSSSVYEDCTIYGNCKPVSTSVTFNNNTYDTNSSYNATYNTWAYNQTFNSTGYAQYQFGSNNFNGSGNVTAGTVYIGSTPNTGMVHPLQISGNLGTPRSSIIRRDIGTTIPKYTGVWNVNTIDNHTVGYIDVTATGATKGGMQITGFTGSDTTATTIPLLMGGVIGTASPGATQPTMVFRGGKWDGSTGVSSIGTTGVLAVWRNWATDVLTIYGNGNIITTGKGTFGGFQLGTSTTAGYVLTADASGIGTWQSAGAGSQTPWGQNIDANGYSLTELGDGTNTLDLCDGSYAVNAVGVVNIVQGSYNALFGGSAGGYFTDASNYVYLADGTSAINAYGASYFEVGGTSHAVEAYQDNNAGGSAGYFHSIAGEIYLADVSNNYAMDGTGDIYLSGKIATTGGYDPPYVLIDEQTKKEIVDRTRKEIAPEKAGGFAIINIPSDARIKWFKPLDCGFYGEKADKDGFIIKTLIETYNDGKGICYNNNVTIQYSWDRLTGNITSHQATQYKTIPLPANKTVDSKTGILKQNIKVTQQEAVQ